MTTPFRDPVLEGPREAVCVCSVRLCCCPAQNGWASLLVSLEMLFYFGKWAAVSAFPFLFSLQLPSCHFLSFFLPASLSFFLFVLPSVFLFLLKT